MRSDSLAQHGRIADEAVIRQVYGAGEIIYTDEGWDSRVYLINGGEAVFKFPRTAQCQEQYRHEVAVLTRLNEMELPVQIPRIRWHGQDATWMGYEGIPGESLTTCIAALDGERKRQIGTAIGGFLKLLRGVILPGLPTRTIEGSIDVYRRKFELAQAALSEALPGREMAIVTSFFSEELPAQLRALGGEQSLCHGDLGPWNIILAQNGGVGVIDFGDAAYRDPSIDFSGFGDQVILDAALHAYGADDLLREKAAIRIKAFPVLDMPFFLGKRDAAGVTACIDLARRTIVNQSPNVDRSLHS